MRDGGLAPDPAAAAPARLASAARTAARDDVPPLPPGAALGTPALLDLFDRSAPHYERIVGAMSLGLGKRYRREAVARAGIAPGMRVLDVGCGPGTLARAVLDAVGRRGSVAAVDPSAAMLREARGSGIGAVACGVAEALPFPDAAFDAVPMGYALRHVGDVVGTFREFRRVLRPGGLVVVLEQTPPQAPLARSLFRAWMRGVVPAISGLVTRSRDARDLMAYYWRTIEDCVDPATVLAALDRAGLVGGRHHVEKAAFSEYVARRP